MRYLSIAVLLLANAASAQSPFTATPDWESSDTPVSTGAALVDLDLDGWLDLVVANGNDIHAETVAVYYNRGDGTLPLVPDWQSGDLRYNGHLSAGDVNGDGWPDMAVAHLGTSDTVAPIARLYLNNAGTLSSLPDWEANEIGNAFGVDLGDINNDGRLDLAVATGWPYGSGTPAADRVYLNVDGQLEPSASWSTAADTLSMNVLWTDGDGDGWLDLVFVSGADETRQYRNLGGTLETSPSWTTAEGPNHFTLMADSGDVTTDGLSDLFAADNSQLFGGSGLLKRYDGLPAGDFSSVSDWSYQAQYCSAVALADINADGLLDLATGGWWSPVRLFLNDGGEIPATPSWSSKTSSVIEKIVLGDVNRSALRRDVETFAAGTQLVSLSRRPVHELLSVTVDGEALLPGEYTLDQEHGRLTVGRVAAEAVEVDYLFTQGADLAVTNWDGSVGNYLFYGRLMTDGNCDGNEVVDLLDYACFATCMDGPKSIVDADVCGRFDADLDRDVDLRDLPAFLGLLEGL